MPDQARARGGQTFYSFVRENLKHIGALKAMGASDGRLPRMLLLQSLTVGIIGYGCGVGLSTLFGLIVIKKGMPPFHMPWQGQHNSPGLHVPPQSWASAFCGDPGISM